MSNLSPTDIIESLIFASEKPVPLKKLAQILALTPEEAQAELDIVREEKARIGALQLVEVQGGWQFVTKPEFSGHIRQLRDAPRQRLSRAAFEVLAIVAYRQPCTRSDIEALRGVDCGGPVQFLLEKKLIAFAGRKETPGRPHLFATTSQFLDHFGLRDIGDLPSLSELSELNQSSLIHDGDSLFNRGAMKSQEEAHDQSMADLAAQDEAAAAEAAAAAQALEEEAAAVAAEVAAEQAEDEQAEAEQAKAQTAITDEASAETASAQTASAAPEAGPEGADASETEAAAGQGGEGEHSLEARILAAAQRAVASEARDGDGNGTAAEKVAGEAKA